MNILQEIDRDELKSETEAWVVADRICEGLSRQAPTVGRPVRIVTGPNSGKKGLVIDHKQDPAFSPSAPVSMLNMMRINRGVRGFLVEVQTGSDSSIVVPAENVERI